MKESIMTRFSRFKDKNHKVGFIISVLMYLILSGSLYAFSITCFVNSEGANFLTSGLSGLALVISRYILPSLGFTLDVNLSFSILYVVLNIPMFFIAYKHIGKIFAILTFSNVTLTSLIISIIDPSMWSFLNVSQMEDITVSLFAGILTGAAIGFALKGNFSTGGTDILSLALSIKKGVSFGKYLMVFNGIIMALGGILSRDWDAILYTFVYIGASSYVVDLIHTRNRKVLLEVVSKKGQEISDVLLKESHHGVTILEGTGAYTKEKKDLLHIVVSTYQIMEVVTIIKSIDSQSFVLQVPVNNIYGKFYIPPFK